MMTDPAAWGVARDYENWRGEPQAVPDATITAVLRAMGCEERDGLGPPGTGADNPVLVTRTGGLAQVEGGPWLLKTEDGGEQRVDGALPADLPLGYHSLRRESDGHDVLLVVAPAAGRYHLPPDLRTWGWAVQLYALRSRHSWGIGDLGDLRRLAEWSRRAGAGMLLLNPLHAATPGPTQQPSPYSPSSRCFRNPIYLRIEEVPGAGEETVARLAAQGQALNADRRIDRDAVWRLKLAALEQAWARFRDSGGQGRDHAGFARYCEEQGRPLTRFATYCVLAERHGSPWWDWPEHLRRPDSPAVARAAADHADRVRFHQWLQWLIQRQLEAAGEVIDLMQDLAIGIDAGGADAWQWQDSFALDVRVGAPPDEFNTQGQNWGLPPFDPWRLRLARYEPYIRTLQAGFRSGGGLRIDHVMGLFRLFWIPVGAGPAEGTYVRYQWREMLDILALESVRAAAYVVGEDLGTVEDMVREELAARDVLSYRLLWFEQCPPEEFPEQALAAVTTHDLPTVAGLWSGADLEEQRALGLDPNEESTAGIRSWLQKSARLCDDEPADQVVVRTYELLARAPSRILVAAIDDALGVEERPNMPCTTSERANWSLALPALLEDIETDRRAAAISQALSRSDMPGRG
jgi:4-alpha-glucanotransferase